MSVIVVNIDVDESVENVKEVEMLGLVRVRLHRSRPLTSQDVRVQRRTKFDTVLTVCTLEQ